MRPFILSIQILAVVAVAARADELRVVNRLPFEDAEFLEEVSGALESLPAELREHIARNGWRIELVTMVVDAAPELRSKRPNGWSAQSVWENADAVHLPKQKRILIATHRRNQAGRIVRTHRVPYVVRHEIGHAVDRIYGNGGKCYSDSSHYVASHLADCASISATARQALDYYARQRSRAARQESFAELFAMQYGGGTERELTDEIREQFPRCRLLVEQLVAM
jgi:hypothetical protein